MLTQSTVVDPVGELLSWLKRPLTRVIIGLAGMPGSGKSTLAGELESAVNRKAGDGTVVALGMDGFHLTKAELAKMPDPDAALKRRGSPWTFDPAAMAERLVSIREAAGKRSVPWPGFEHGVGDPVPDASLVPADTRLILVEGLYLCHHDHGWAAVNAQFDETWFLDTTFELSMDRLAARHMASWGVTRQEADTRIARNDRLNAEIVLASRPNADRILRPQ